MKKILSFFMVFLGFVFFLRPFNVIFLWIASIILNIFLANTAFIVLQVIFFAFSVLLFVWCMSTSLSGYFCNFSDPVLKKYYCAIHWNIGAEMQSFWCSNFAFWNFLYGGFVTYRYGMWWILIASAVYWLIYIFSC